MAIALIAVVVYRVWPYLHPDVVARAPLDPACDLNTGACTAQLPAGGTITLEVAPRPVPVVTPLDIRVQLQDIAPLAVEVDFSGVDMDMGFNRFALEPDEERNRYQGRGTLPVCVRDRMLWEATVLVTTRGGVVAAPFRFESVRPD